MSITASDAISNLKQMERMAKAIKQKIDTISGIGSIRVNGTAVPATEGVVDLTIPTKTSQLSNDSGYQANVIETIKVNNTAQTPSAKAVNITVPTKTSQLTNDSTYVPSADVQVFSCTLKANGWSNNSGTYTQTVTCTGVTAAMDLEAPEVPATGVQATDIALKQGLSVLCDAGNYGETLDGQVKWTCYNAIPTVDLPLRMRRAKV